MPSFREYRRRSIVPLAAIALAAYYVMVFLPLGRKAQSQNPPLEKAWQKLAASLDQTNATTIDFARITNQLAETRQAIAAFDAAKKKAVTRLETGPALRARLSAPFQLVEYQNERSKEMDELSKVAKEHQVALEPGVLTGLPEHTVDVKQPELLWAALAMSDDLLRTALVCNVAAIYDFEVRLALTNAPSTNGSERLTEIPIQIEFSASATNTAALLQALPLRPEEIRAAGLPEATPDKRSLFLEHLVLKKQSPDKPDELRVALRVLGFVMRE
jgi:hypothetical protein